MFDWFLPYGYITNNGVFFEPWNQALWAITDGVTTGGYIDTCGVREERLTVDACYQLNEADVSGSGGYDSYFNFLIDSDTSTLQQTSYRGNIYIAPPVSSLTVTESNGSVSTMIPVTNNVITSKTLTIPVSEVAYEVGITVTVQI